MIVTLVIVSILASVALPYARIGVQRVKETELKYALRKIRSALDSFHNDWDAERFPKQAEGVGEYGFPKSLEVLIVGVDKGDAKGTTFRYLRRIPDNPMFIGDDPQEQWQFRSYQDDIDSRIWGGEDVYDVAASTDRLAIDGSQYSDW